MDFQPANWLLDLKNNAVFRVAPSSLLCVSWSFQCRCIFVGGIGNAPTSGNALITFDLPKAFQETDTTGGAGQTLGALLVITTDFQHLEVTEWWGEWKAVSSQENDVMNSENTERIGSVFKKKHVLGMVVARKKILDFYIDIINKSIRWNIFCLHIYIYTYIYIYTCMYIYTYFYANICQYAVHIHHDVERLRFWWRW